MKVSMKYIPVLSGKWDLGGSTPLLLGGHCLAAGGFWNMTFPPLMTKGSHFSCVSLKKRFLCDSFPTDKVSVPLPG